MIFITLLLLLSSCTPAPQEPARVESLSSTSAIISTGVMTETPKNEAVTGSSETPLPEYLWHELTGTGLEFVKVLDDNSAYTRYQIYYLSDGLRISGIMNIPKGDGTLLTLSFPREEHLEADNKKDTTIDIRGTIRIIAGISGLFAMIFFAMMNNFI